MNNYKVGFVTGAFDLLHAGHVHFLKGCKKKCDYLIVGLHLNPKVEREKKNKPVESIVERQIRLLGCEYVDDIWVYETEEDLSLLLSNLKPDVRFLGSDYRDGSKPITDPDATPIEYVDSLPIHTTDLRERIKNAK